MTKQLADRLSWAVELLQVQPDDHILEIGCGHGSAIALVCEKLADGKITAIDRSKTMIEVARKKNSACIEATRAELIASALHQADFGASSFNKVFAINVNVFWMKPTKELAVLRERIAPGGSLFLIYQAPSDQKTQEIIPRLQANLRENGFTNLEVINRMFPSGAVVCVTAKLPG
jgi:cyclopropane fatty-acyl-phospholipid synthase-like methyltransferase